LTWKPDGEALLVNGIRCELTPQEAAELSAFMLNTKLAVNTVHDACGSSREEAREKYLAVHNGYKDFALRMLDKALSSFSGAKQKAYERFMRTGEISGRYRDWLKTLVRN
jgi:hypothetical protein